MPKFKIFKREVWVQRVTVEAETLAMAIEIAESGEPDDDPNSLEYSHTMAADTWTASNEDFSEYWDSGELHETRRENRHAD